MFENSLVISGTERHDNQWSALVSFTIQTLFVGALIVIPMLFTDQLPFRAMKQIVQIHMRLVTPHIENQPISPSMGGNVCRNILRVPAPSFRNPVTLVDPSVLRHDVSSGPPTLDRLAERGGDSQLDSLFPAGRAITPTIHTSAPKHWRISGGVEQGLVIRNVKPIYPAIALAAGIEGDVVLQAEIGKDGRIENLRAVSGNPLLIKAALDAVQQWRYRPYLLNGGPVEVETQITVRFGMH